MQVLIADDDPVTRRLVQSYLQKWGYEVTAAPTGAEAWRLFQAAVFPIVITDWMMPEMDGLELVTAMRAHPKHKTIPVIMASTWPGNDQQRIARDAGAADYLVKPFRAEALKSAIAAIGL